MIKFTYEISVPRRTTQDRNLVESEAKKDVAEVNADAKVTVVDSSWLMHDGRNSIWDVTVETDEETFLAFADWLGADPSDLRVEE